MAFRSLRTRLRAFQQMRGDPPMPGSSPTLNSSRTAISASPGAPLRLDAASQTWLTVIILLALAPLTLVIWAVILWVKLA